jgi:Zn-dependent M28 family amino/carboxypeptidase
VNNILVSLTLFLAAYSGGATGTAPCNDSICVRDLRADLFFLAGDGFRGRLTGSSENTLANAFIASRFERLGLAPRGDDGTCLRRFNLSRSTLGEGNTLTVEKIVGPGEPFVTRLRMTLGSDFTPARFSASGTVKSMLAFAGFGIVDPARGRDDYKGQDVRNYIVLVLDHEPGENDPESQFDGLVMSEAATPWRKALTAQEKGAEAILFVTDVQNHPEPENFEATAQAAWPEKAPRLERYLLQEWVDRVRIPAAHLSIAATRALLATQALNLDDICRSAEKGSSKIDFRNHLSLSTDVRRHVVADRNVLGAIEGSDPKLKEEWVVISCHQDHDGAEGSFVYNGADDNGSGVVGLLEIAEAYALAAKEGHRPKRSILFAAFNSEERGLLGSWAFVERPPIPLEKIVAVLNMDMIGRDEEVPEGGGRRFRGIPPQTAESNKNAVNVLGYSRTASLVAAVEEANTPFGLTIKKVLDNTPANLLRRSDQWPFLHSGVPAVFFHTGLHPDYHTPGDRPERIRYDKMERIVRLIHQTSWELAQSPERPLMDGKTPAPKTR